ncbi:unnamed protein product [Brassica oleracea var. botrytis]
MEKLMLSKYQSFFYYMEQNGWNRDNGLGDDELLTCSRTRMLRPCNHCFVETRENKGESRCLRQAQKLPVGGRLKQKRELANLGNMQVKEAEKSNKCKKRKVDTDYDDDSEASGTSSLVPEFTLNQKEIIRPGVPKMFAEMHMPKEETVFKIHDPKRNKSWSVVSKIQSRFSRGWPGLVKDFGLKVGDVCTFELIKPTEMILTVDSM